jgi:hypothetical protein
MEVGVCERAGGGCTRQVGHKYRLILAVFARIIEQSPSIRAAMLGAEYAHLINDNSYDVQALADVPFVSSHIDRFNHFMDQVRACRLHSIHQHSSYGSSNPSRRARWR